MLLATATIDCRTNGLPHHHSGVLARFVDGRGHEQEQQRYGLLPLIKKRRLSGLRKG